MWIKRQVLAYLPIKSFNLNACCKMISKKQAFSFAYVVFLFVGVIVIFAILVYLIYKWTQKEIEKRKFIERTSEEHGMSEEAAEALHDVNKAHKRIVYNEKFKKHARYHRELDNGRISACHKHDYYRLMRWCSRLEEIKHQTPNTTICFELDAIVNEMKQKADEYSINQREKENLLKLLEQPESTLRQYDGLYV
ncbi:hypothetical protein M3Y97_00616600 [Aphelenchoides bicaudatus]|nr:hypothetical protein M3Y97_00616600 [Aphelenchoides bicaudatus]